HPPRDLPWQSLRSVVYRVAVPTRLALPIQQGGWRTLAEAPWVDGLAGSHIHQLLHSLFEPQGLMPRATIHIQDTSGLAAYVRAGSGCALLREEIAMRGAERDEWLVWGPARLDAGLFLVSAVEGGNDPLAVAFASMVQGVWGSS
ncbi:MAG: LysR family transcriptional regulator, partial [Alcaligenaceae bacterium]